MVIRSDIIGARKFAKRLASGFRAGQQRSVNSASGRPDRLKHAAGQRKQRKNIDWSCLFFTSLLTNSATAIVSMADKKKLFLIKVIAEV